MAQVKVELADHHFKITCPQGYPQTAPEVTVRDPEGQEVPFAFEWDADCFLSDLVREALLAQTLGGETNDSQAADPEADSTADAEEERVEK